MMDERILLLNQAAREVYHPTSTERQRQADETFERLSENPENLGLILDYLEHGEKPYGEYIASTTLKKLSERRITISVSEQLQLANQLLQFMAAKGETANSFTITKLSDVYANLCKFNFNHRNAEKQYPFRMSLANVQNAIATMDAQGALALNLLTAVIATFDEQKPSESNTEHRIVHNEFQNKFLRDFNTAVIDQFIAIAEKLKNGGQVSWTYLKAMLGFYKRLLEYEFLGSSFDVDERETVDIPSSWRLKIMCIYQPLFEIYRFIPATEETCLKQTLEIAGLVASVRRTLYDSTERIKIVQALLDGVGIVLSDVAKLGMPEIFVEFSRLLYRINRNFTFSDLSRHELFMPTLLPLLSQFTIQAFEAFDSSASNGIFYLLAFWQRIAIHGTHASYRDDWDSVTNSPEPNDPVIASLKPIPTAFIHSRMRLCHLSSIGEADSPFDDPVSIAQYMDHFAGLCRVDVMPMRYLMSEIFNQNTEILSNSEPGSQQYLLAELKLIFWTYIVGSCIGSVDLIRPCFEEESPELYDIDLFANVNILSKFNLERMQHFGTQDIPDNVIQLEVAILTTFDKFRVAYLNETNRNYSEMQRRLVDRLQLEREDEALWEIYLQKIAKNIQAWGAVEEIISRTLTLFSTVTTSTITTKKMWNLQTTKYMITNHDANIFPFLNSFKREILRCRSDFYCSLMRIVVNGIDTNEIIFDDFMKPVQDRTDQIARALQTTNIDEDFLKMSIAGLARDYRGLIEACTRVQPYSWLTGYCQDKIYNIFQVAVQRFYDEPVVTVSIFKFLAELTMNRNARLAFNLNHFRSTAIFMEVAKIIQNFCALFITLPDMDPNDKSFHAHRMKVVTALLLVIKNILNGNYLPIALFYWCNDLTLKNSLEAVLQVFSKYAVYAEKYPKTVTAFNEVVFELARLYPAFATKMRVEDLVVVFHYLEMGIHANERSKLMNACTTFERLTDILLENNNRRKQLENVHSEPMGDSLSKCFEQHPKIIANFFTYFMNMIVNDVRPLHYMTARVLYNAMFLRPDMYSVWKQEFASQCPLDVIQIVENVLKEFSSESFSAESRELFTVKIEQIQTTLRDASRFGQNQNSMDQ